MEGKKGISEDWLSLWIGLCIFVLGLGLFAGLDLLGWGVKTSVWTDITKALSPVSGTLKGMPGLTSLLLTYVFMLVIMEIGAIVMGVNVGRFMLGFTLVFWIGFGCWLLGHFGYIAATDAAKAGIGWSLKLTGEAGFIVALIVGLIVGNFFTKLAGTLQEATRPELYVKTAIVIMGAGLGVKAAEAAGLAVSGTRFNYAYGKLMLWSGRPDAWTDARSWLKRGAFAHLAIANPKTAPYGLAAEQVMDRLGVLSLLQGKLVRGDSLSQTFQFVVSGNAAAGFVAASQVKAWKGSGTLWEVPQDLYAPIEQQAVLLGRGESNPAAAAFLGFLKGEAARDVIRSYGYGVE